MVVVIVNPASGRRRGASSSASLRAALGRGARVIETRAAGDAARRAQMAVLEGATTVLSVGGDGTHSEVVNGIMQAAPEPGAVTLGVLHAGTGGDFCRLVRGDRDGDVGEAAVELLAQRSKPIDVGVVSYQHGDGHDWCYFLNIASFGLGGQVDRYVNRSSKRLGGTATYYLATLRALATYRPARVALFADGVDLGDVEISQVIVANGRYAGGGMALAPEAKLGDGLLDVVVIRSASPQQTVGLSRHLYSGTLLESSLVDSFRCAHLRAERVERDAWLDIDGEAPGKLPAEFSIVPGAVRLLGPRVGVV